MKIVTKKYKYLEAINILKNKELFNESVIKDAESFKKKYESENKAQYNPVTYEQREYLKTKYKNLY